jgi:ferric-dicitrate binding protein FerR (iron transport regulator)
MTEDTTDRTPDPPGSEPALQDPTQQLAEVALWERFLAGESTEGEEERVRGWAAASQSTPAHTAQAVRAAAMAALRGSGDPPAVDALQMLRVLEERLAIGPRQPAGVRSIRSASQGARRAIASLTCAAAAAVILIMAAPAGRPVIRSIHVGPRDTGTFQTGPGERLHLSLSDGTEVSAAPATSVRVVGPSDHRDI